MAEHYKATPSTSPLVDNSEDIELENQKAVEVADERVQWGSKLEFMLSCVGYAVGLGNVWRFPYLCYTNGGASFLIPYFIALAVNGIPLFYMELAIGQYFSVGTIGTWTAICPIARGIGFAQIMVTFLVGIYYNVIIACHKILQISDGIENLGSINWEVTLSLLFAWVLVYLCTVKGVKSSGKVVYFTATFPYIVLVILFFRGITLDGVDQGLLFYLTPDFKKLASAEAWVRAATQIFYSLGVGFGALLTFGSYNPFHNNCEKDALVVCLINCGTSFFAGFVIFSVVGYMAFFLQTTVDKVADSGPGLAFVVYPEAISQMPVSTLWAILFFFMLITLGLDSQFAGVECVVTSLSDEYPKYLRKYKWIFLIVNCVLYFLLALPMCAEGGMYVFNLFDYQTGGISLLFIVFCEAVVIGWCVGTDFLSDIIETMTGKRPNMFFLLCWKYIAPLFTLSIIIAQLAMWKGVTYNNKPYPGWAELIGWLLALTSMSLIPIYAVIQYYYAKGNTVTEVVIWSIRVIQSKHILRNMSGRYYDEEQEVNDEMPRGFETRGVASTAELLDTESDKIDENLKTCEVEVTDDREKWGSKVDFMLSCVGYAVGLGNVWRFPYLCYSNGGASFLIPYFIMLAINGIPLFYMELAVGQYLSLGTIGAWTAICPLSRGKVVYFTATFPYVVLVILFFRGVTLDGAGEGVLFYINPDFKKLANPEVWVRAATQIFYSLGVGFGSLLTFGSYNRFNNNCEQDALIVCLINCGTSFFAGFVIFSVMGYMAFILETTVDQVADNGPGLAFVAYPEAISQMPVSTLWAILFFFMLITLGLDSQFAMVEVVVTALSDEYPKYLRKYKWVFLILICTLLFVLALPMCAEGGMYVFNLFDYQSGGVSLLVVGFCEALVIGWGVGTDVLADMIETMTGKRPNIFFMICWKYLSPMFTLGIIIAQLAMWQGVSYNKKPYPDWAEFFGWILAFASIIQIPIFAVIQYYHAEGKTIRE
ncbi:hypothetical protein QZH41_010658, partial [Actinostola sp. cb2023]